MDPVLSRKLFRQKYIEEIKPQKFNKGGIATLKLAEGGAVFSEGEKLGYMLAPIAASLLQAKQAPGQSSLASLFGAVGEGVSQIPAIGLKMAEIEGKKKTVSKEVGLATPAEIKQLGGDPRDKYVVSREGGVLTGIVEKPSEKFREERGLRDTALDQINRIEYLYNELGEPSGPVEGNVNKALSYLGQAPAISRLIAEGESFRKNAIAAMRGAQVGPKEEATFDAIMPSITDSPAVYKQKLAASKQYIMDLNKRIGGEGKVTNPGEYDFTTVENILGSKVGAPVKDAPTYRRNPNTGLERVQ
jgi:hypothetical protein